MRALLVFARVDLDRWLLPILPAQDAAGPGESGDDWFGAFSMALAFPRVSLLEEVLSRKLGEDKAQRKLLKAHVFCSYLRSCSSTYAVAA